MRSKFQVPFYFFKIPLYPKARKKSLKLSDIESNKNLGLLRFSSGGGKP